uniref:Uncharacterized protein n=1 Tax=Parascaris equorum TaxID=6256 RepID=A0A914RYK1_PAREQ
MTGQLLHIVPVMVSVNIVRFFLFVTNPEMASCSVIERTVSDFSCDM